MLEENSLGAGERSQGENEVKALQNIQPMRAVARTRQNEADRHKDEAKALKD